MCVGGGLSVYHASVCVCVSVSLYACVYGCVCVCVCLSVWVGGCVCVGGSQILALASWLVEDVTNTSKIAPKALQGACRAATLRNLSSPWDRPLSYSPPLSHYAPSPIWPSLFKNPGSTPNIRQIWADIQQTLSRLSGYSADIQQI